MTVSPPDLSIPLKTRKVPSTLGHLDYVREPAAQRQRRLAGRETLRPLIDLKAYTARAVIDWIEIHVTLKRTTTFQWLQRPVAKILGRTPFVDNLSGDPNEASRSFSIRIQEPRIKTVLKAAAYIEKKFGLDTRPALTGLEISIDFYPRKPSALSRAKIGRVLMNHLLPAQDLVTNPLDRPRTVWGKKKKQVSRLLYHSKTRSPEENDHYLLSIERDEPPFADATLNIGEKNSAVSWRVMEKIIDVQNKSSGTYVVLEEEKKRARIEVTLNQEAIGALGIHTLADLAKLNFTHLQGRYFRFFLPTFYAINSSSPEQTKHAARLWLDKWRAIKFAKTGSIGLRAMDDAFVRMRRQIRDQVGSILRRQGIRLKPASRVALGTAGSFAAYDDLNARVQVALRGLQRRVAADFREEEEKQSGSGR